MPHLVLRAVAILAFAANAAAQSPFLSQRYNPADLTGKLSPPFTLEAPGQPAISDSSLRGHPALLIFWSTWCRNCSVPIRQLPPLLAGSGIQVVGIDFDRDPALAQAFLKSHPIDAPNFHVDLQQPGSVTRIFHMVPPYPIVVLLDEKGRVVYSQKTEFPDELLAAIASLGSPYAPFVNAAKASRPPTSFSAYDARELARQATVLEASYLGQQASYICRYELITRDHYETGMSRNAVRHDEETFTTEGHQLDTHVVPVSGPVPGDPPSTTPVRIQPVESTPPIATESFNVWSDPVFAAVIQHSLFTNLEPSSKETGGITSNPDHVFLYLTFRGDPSFTPRTDHERIAQSLEGWLVVDTLNRTLAMLDAQSAYDVVDKSRLLVEKGFPVLSFQAVPFHGAYLPSTWSSAVYQPVPTGRDAHRLWLTTLTRTFGRRESCDTTNVKSAILPGTQTISAAPPK